MSEVTVTIPLSVEDYIAFEESPTSAMTILKVNLFLYQVQQTITMKYTSI
jgi:hypothetical protein